MNRRRAGQEKSRIRYVPTGCGFSLALFSKMYIGKKYALEKSVPGRGKS
jgi:hypothetical protein